MTWIFSKVLPLKSACASNSYVYQWKLYLYTPIHLINSCLNTSIALQKQKQMVRSPDGDTNFFDIIAGVF